MEIVLFGLVLRGQLTSAAYLWIDAESHSDAVFGCGTSAVAVLEGFARRAATP